MELSFKIKLRKKRGMMMKKIIVKLLEAYARSSTTSCSNWLIHAPKAPKSLIKE